MMYVTVNDCQIYYEVHGQAEGATIFFIQEHRDLEIAGQI